MYLLYLILLPRLWSVTEGGKCGGAAGVVQGQVALPAQPEVAPPCGTWQPSGCRFHSPPVRSSLVRFMLPACTAQRQSATVGLRSAPGPAVTVRGCHHWKFPRM